MPVTGNDRSCLATGDSAATAPDGWRQPLGRQARP